MYTQPKKSLGQNFLVDKNIQNKIISLCALKPEDIVLEIGPGRGELTKLLVTKVSKVYAVEIDAALALGLKIYFKGCKNIEIINKDILEFDFERHIKEKFNKIKIIGNIPYYITTPIFEYLINIRNRIDTIFITVQKEFAERITASCGSKEYGSLSCFLQYYTYPKIIFNINKGCFYPLPNIDSSFLCLKIKQELPLAPQEEKVFFKITRAAFSKRRKTLRNSLEGVVSQEGLKIFFDTYHINPNIRPECLSPEDFVNLSKIQKLCS